MARNETTTIVVNENGDTVTCQWFALCVNDATQLVPHPILGDVPACDRCADKAAKS